MAVRARLRASYLKSLSAVDRRCWLVAVEVAKLERRLPLLATTASITPFIARSARWAS